MKPIIIVIKEGKPTPYRFIKDFCEAYGFTESRVYHWKFPKHLKKLDITVYNENFYLPKRRLKAKKIKNNNIIEYNIEKMQ